MTSVIPKASKAMPDPSEQRTADTGDQQTPTALYRLYAADDTLLYIGVSDDPDRRFKQHRDTKPWWPQVARNTIEWRSSRALALAEETAAIKAETPVYNIDHNPAAVSYHWPPAGMPADRVDAIEREASTLPDDLAEGIRRAAWEAFTHPVAKARIDRWVDEALTALAKPTPTEAFNALVAEHPGLQVEEWDMSTLDEDLRNDYACHYEEHKDGRRLLVVPAGQNPTERLAAVRVLLAHPAVTA